MPLWTLEPTDQFARDREWFEKNHSQELANMLNNVRRYLVQIKAAKNSKCVQAGFLHHEPGGVVAIDQRGEGGALQQTRLYTYADDVKKVLYLITIGNKKTQQSDIKVSKEFVAELTK